MRIPQGNWLVVRRHVRDTTTRGEIVKGGLTEQQARSLARQYGDCNTAFNYWAVLRTEY